MFGLVMPESVLVASKAVTININTWSLEQVEKATEREKQSAHNVRIYSEKMALKREVENAKHRKEMAAKLKEIAALALTPDEEERVDCFMAQCLKENSLK